MLAAFVASACLSAPVSYAAPRDTGAPAIPWIHAGPVSGYLFYYGASGPWKAEADRVLITTGGGLAGRYATKILWHVRRGSASLTIAGQRLDGVGRFRQRLTSVGNSYFPSIVTVPNKGCWRLTVSSGRQVGRFAFVALTP